MDGPRHVAAPPPRPVMLYDGDCGFCEFWVRRGQRITGAAVDYVPFQDRRVPGLFPELRGEGLREAVHFIDAGGTVYRGAEAVFHSLALNLDWQWPLRWYDKSPALAWMAEGCYRFIAGHRALFSRLTHVL